MIFRYDLLPVMMKHLMEKNTNHGFDASRENMF